MLTLDNKTLVILSLVILVFIMLVTIIILLNIQMNSKGCPNCNKHKSKGLSGAYLNYASTNATKTGSFNPSDIGYSQMMDQRNDIEMLKNKYRQLVNAPPDAKVIFNSGASESIANCVFWAKSYNPYGTIVGTKYDHSAVKANCETFGMKYNDQMTEKSLMNNCAMIFLTQVNSRTGEIMNLDTFNRNFSKFSFMNDSNTQRHPFNEQNTMQYRPIIVLDAAQSFNKVPIYMDRWGVNAVFFSLHKFGGPIGAGVLIVDDKIQFPFKPLISGHQQMSLRGGTLPMQQFLDSEWILDEHDDLNSRKGRWLEVMQQIESSGLKVYQPKNTHLYNTFLICVKGCPMKVIAKLANEGIYVGNVSACKNEEIYNKSLSGGDIEVSSELNNGSNFDNSVRISFSDGRELTDNIVSNIIQACKESFENE